MLSSTLLYSWHKYCLYNIAKRNGHNVAQGSTVYREPAGVEWYLNSTLLHQLRYATYYVSAQDRSPCRNAILKGRGYATRLAILLFYYLSSVKWLGCGLFACKT